MLSNGAAGGFDGFFGTGSETETGTTMALSILPVLMTLAAIDFLVNNFGEFQAVQSNFFPHQLWINRVN